jgi:hypothetical protein
VSANSYPLLVTPGNRGGKALLSTIEVASRTDLCGTD